MYGIVNKAIQEMVTEYHGEEMWESIKFESGVHVEYFITNEPYPDEFTFSLAQTTAVKLQQPLAEILTAFGKYWVLKTGRLKYGALLETGGSSLKDFLVNLPVFHNRIMLIYPNLKPPEFKISNISERSLHVHYFSHRDGLTLFVKGLLLGIGELFNVQCEVALVEEEGDKESKAIFRVAW